MAKKTSGQNPVDEAYLRSLMAGSPPEKVTPSIPPKEETDRETAEKAKTESEAEEMPEKDRIPNVESRTGRIYEEIPHPLQMRRQAGCLYRQGTAPENIGHRRHCR